MGEINMKTISGNKVIYKFENFMEHVEIIRPGDIIKVETND